MRTCTEAQSVSDNLDSNNVPDLSCECYVAQEQVRRLQVALDAAQMPAADVSQQPVAHSSQLPPAQAGTAADAGLVT